jgi:hypothetical protein
MDRQACVGMLAPTCAQRQMPTPRRVVEPVAPTPPTQVTPPVVAVPQPELSTTVMRLREMGSSSTSAWFIAALLSLLVLGTLAGYAASLLAVR